MSKENVAQGQEMVEMRALSQRPTPAMSLMYCGPAIPGVASHGMLFTTMPDGLMDCANVCPAINSFVVEPKEYVKIKQEMERMGNLLYIQYRMVLEYLEGR